MKRSRIFLLKSPVIFSFLIFNNIVLSQAHTITYDLIKEEPITLKVSPTIWSRPTEDQSSRLLYYKKPAPDLRYNNQVLVSKASGRRLFENTISWPTVGKGALLVYKLDANGKKEYEAIYDFNGKMLSKIEFDSTDKVAPMYYFDDGQYIGVDYYTGMFHVVNPSRNVYEKISVFDKPLKLEYREGISHQSLYDPIHQDMFISISARSHYSLPEKRYAYVNLLIDRDGKVLWRRDKPRLTWATMSPDGEYVALFNEDPDKDFEGPVEIIRRDGTTICTIQTPFSVSRDKFSDDSRIIGFRDKHKKYRIYDVQTGQLLNVFVFMGFNPIEDVAINNRLGILAVLRNDPSALAGHRFVSVYPLDGSAKKPLWEFDMGSFDRKSEDYANVRHISISKNGKEITAYSSGNLRIFRLQEQE